MAALTPPRPTRFRSCRIPGGIGFTAGARARPGAAGCGWRSWGVGTAGRPGWRPPVGRGRAGRGGDSCPAVGLAPAALFSAGAPQPRAAAYRASSAYPCSGESKIIAAAARFSTAAAVRWAIEQIPAATGKIIIIIAGVILRHPVGGRIPESWPRGAGVIQKIIGGQHTVGAHRRQQLIIIAIISARQVRRGGGGSGRGGVQRGGIRRGGVGQRGRRRWISRFRGNDGARRQPVSESPSRWNRPNRPGRASSKRRQPPRHRQGASRNASRRNPARGAGRIPGAARPAQSPAAGCPADFPHHRKPPAAPRPSPPAGRSAVQRSPTASAFCAAQPRRFCHRHQRRGFPIPRSGANPRNRPRRLRRLRRRFNLWSGIHGFHRWPSHSPPQAVFRYHTRNPNRGKRGRVWRG